jgi:hypothetical protein
MAERESPFAEEWRDCLREHYKHVIRENDTSTEDTLTPILHQIGFRDNELHQLRVQADPTTYNEETANALSNGNGAANGASEDVTFKVHPAECTCAACMDIVLEDGHDDEGQPLAFPDEPDEGEGNVFQVVKVADAIDDTDETDITDDEAASDESDDTDDDSPKQRSLF